MEKKISAVELSDDMLDAVSGGNRYSDSKLVSCSRCKVMTPSTKLVNGVCPECSTAQKNDAVAMGNSSHSGIKGGFGGSSFC